MTSPGTELTRWGPFPVEAGPMKTAAALIRDPNPIHFDPAASERAGLGPRTVNQGPLNLAYIINMLLANGPGTHIEALDVRFVSTIFAGDQVTAGGAVRASEAGHDGERIEAVVWLDGPDGERAIEGTASIFIPSGEDPLPTEAEEGLDDREN